MRFSLRDSTLKISTSALMCLLVPLLVQHIVERSSATQQTAEALKNPEQTSPQTIRCNGLSAGTCFYLGIYILKDRSLLTPLLIAIAVLPKSLSTVGTGAL